MSTAIMFRGYVLDSVCFQLKVNLIHFFSFDMFCNMITVVNNCCSFSVIFSLRVTRLINLNLNLNLI